MNTPVNPIRRSVWAFVLATALSAPIQVHAEPKVDPVVLLKQATGKDAGSLKDFLADQGAASISAASLAGIGTTPLTIVQDTKDFAVLLSPFDKESKGGGFVLTPARARHPLPRIDLKTEYVPNVWWRIASAANISGAQGKTDVQGTEYRRRAVALSTGAFFDKLDDPIYQRAVATLQVDASGALVGDACAADFFKTVEDQSADLPGSETGAAGSAVTANLDAARSSYKACVERVYAESRSRWFAPRWSVAYGTGDAQPSAGGTSARTGDVLALGVTYGRPWRAPSSGAAKSATASVLSGWAVTVVARYTRGEPVLASLSSGLTQRQDSSLVVGRLAAGTESWRLMLEASDNDAKKASAGERTLKQALGLDWRVAKDSWLNIRYGQRDTATGSGVESATMLNIVLGGDLLTF